MPRVTLTSEEPRRTMTTDTIAPGAPAGPPPPSAAVERRHLTREEAEGTFVKHSQLLPWLGGTIVAVALIAGTFAVWVLGSAKQAAIEPVGAVNAKVEIVTGEVDSMKREIAGVKSDVATLSTKVEAQGRDQQVAIASVKTLVEDSQRTVSQKIDQKVDSLTTLLLTGQIVVPHRETRAPR